MLLGLIGMWLRQRRRRREEEPRPRFDIDALAPAATGGAALHGATDDEPLHDVPADDAADVPEGAVPGAQFRRIVVFIFNHKKFLIVEYVYGATERLRPLQGHVGRVPGSIQARSGPNPTTARLWRSASRNGGFPVEEQGFPGLIGQASIFVFGQKRNGPAAQGGQVQAFVLARLEDFYGGGAGTAQFAAALGPRPCLQWLPQPGPCACAPPGTGRCPSGRFVWQWSSRI